MNLDLTGLNDRQREAATAGDGPLLILAGAGSGKTRTLAYRVAWLIERGVAPGAILAVTFTNKAAGELRDRVRALLERKSIDAWVGTFHSFCAWLLRREHEAAGVPREFSIYDADDQVSVMKRVLAGIGLVGDGAPRPQVLLSFISSLKDDLVAPEEFSSRASAPFERLVAQVYPLYQAALRRSGALDFDDLLVEAVRLLEAPELRAKYSGRFGHVLVDEYQDTNHAQYRLVALLASSHRNVTVVGDDDQSIYAWRGADIRNILEFERDFANARIVTLERNYRSTPEILLAASSVIAHNAGRKPKTLWTESQSGAPLERIVCEDERDEGARVIARAKREEQDGASLGDMVVLYRTNAQSRAFEDECRRIGMPYTIVGGVRFYERAEVKDVLSYLRLLVNLSDREAFLRVVNNPPRGIGAASLSEFEAFRGESGLGVIEACRGAERAKAIRPAARAALVEFGSLIEDMREQVSSLDAGAAVRMVLDRTGYLALLSAEMDPESTERAANVRELSAAASSYSARAEDPSLLGFLSEVSLLTDVDRYESGSGITLMTAHAAKGLEFPIVFVAGLEEGLFPLLRDDDPASMEEERRLFYVCLTRAMRKVFLCHAMARRRYGAPLEPQRRSRFLSEIPADAMAEERQQAYVPDPRPRRTARRPPDAWNESQEEVVIAPGRRVRHPIFGEGTVERVDGSGSTLRVTVRFGSETKRLVAAYAGLELL